MKLKVVERSGSVEIEHELTWARQIPLTAEDLSQIRLAAEAMTGGSLPHRHAEDAKDEHEHG